ncbi:MAG TPA: efflux RND transporter periplasmic adaptor subunit, partial [Polyangiales bacterium]|nr:efflux RND transporter periplasmic adaptor subunit [Polyangiales bacterium]
MKRFLITSVVVIGVGTALYMLSNRTPSELVLTGVVTTDDVNVSAQLAGQIDRLLVKEGDHVERDQLLAVLSDAELSADRNFFERTAESSHDQMQESAATMHYQEQLVAQQIREADATLASVVAQYAEAKANLELARQKLARDEAVWKTGGLSAETIDLSRNAYAVAQARTDAFEKQVEAQRAALGLARSAEQQVLAKRSALSMATRQLEAATAQKVKADVRLAYTELRAPIAGIVDVRAARAGEVVSVGQPVVSLVDPDDFWVRADVEESYIDRVRIGDTLQVKLPSGELRRG